MIGLITWAVGRRKDGSMHKTVFCLDCRKVFGENLDAGSARAIRDKVREEHYCTGGGFNIMEGP